MDPLAWVVIGIVCLGLEAVMFTLVIGLLGLAALATASAAALGASLVIQLLVMVSVSFGSIALLRPIATSHRRRPTHQSGVAALSGTTGRTMSETTEDGGQIWLGGEVWTARSEFEDERISEGVRVSVVRIDGATAVVQEIE